MHKFIKKYQKKLLAIFAVLLMIAFVATLGPSGMSGRGPRAQIVVGHFGKESLYENDMSAAKDQWQILMRTRVSTRQSFGRELPLPTLMLPAPIVEDIEKHPELFVLLQKDAEQHGALVNVDEAKSFWVNQLNRPAEFLSTQETLAMKGILTIVSEYQQLAQAVKVSQPMWKREAAQQYQGVKLNLVDFRADEFEKSVPAPTTQQLQAHFEKYKNTPSRQQDSIGDDSLGFGYQIPTRVKLQYLEIPHAEVVASLQPTPEVRHEWDVKAADYYLAHPEEFRNPATEPAATEPASQPATTQGALAAATQAAASTQPAIKPFEQVKAEIVEKLMATDVAKQTAAIEKELTSRLATDWIEIRKANPSATQPATTQFATTQPDATSQPGATSQPASEEMKLTQLEKIRTDIQQKLHVSLVIHEYNDWQDSKQLGALPGVGNARTNDQDSFADYALHFTGQRGMVMAVALQVWEPSQPLTDLSQNFYVFRLMAAEPAHAPTDITPVLAQVTKDWRIAQAYELARQAATKLAESAKANGLAQASRTAGLAMLATGPISPRSPRNIAGYPLTDPAAQQDLGQAARKLLQMSSQADPHPSTLFELPTVQRVGVAELATAQLEFPEWYVQSEVVGAQRQMNMVKLASDWFEYAKVVNRLDYRPEAKAGS
jgi:hypothetical protein